MKRHPFGQYTDEELVVIARIDRALADEVFALHRKQFDVRHVLHEARALKTEAQMIRKELNRRERER